MAVDLNADLGEGFGAWRMGDDEAMLEVVTSASIACGFHAGDPLTMLASCRRAAERGVRVGAHVAYRDLAGFGRRTMEIAPDELYGDVLYQLAALDGIARAAGTRVSYVKPHGALYNRIVTDAGQAQAVASAARDFDPALPLLGLPGSAVESAAGAAFRREAFADRAYTTDGTLVPRGTPGAVITDPLAVADRAVRIVRDGVVDAVDGTPVPVSADSLCVHGDTPGAVQLARTVRRALHEAGIELRAFS